MECPRCSAVSKLVRTESPHRTYHCGHCMRRFGTIEVHTGEAYIREMKVAAGALAVVRRRLTELARATLREKGYLQ